jgi:dynein heavy chain 1
MFTMLNQCVRNVLTHNQQKDFPLAEEVVEKYVTKSLVLAVLWSFAGDCKLKSRVDLGHFIAHSTTVQMPSNAQIPVIDYEVRHNKKRQWASITEFGNMKFRGRRKVKKSA